MPDIPRPAQAAIHTDLGAIFVSLELSRRAWLITSLSPGAGEKMSKHSVPASDVSGLLHRFAELRRKAEARTGRDFPIIVIQEAGLDGFWIHRVLQSEVRLKYPLRNIKPYRASLAHGRLPWWLLNTTTLAHRCRRGAFSNRSTHVKAPVYVARPGHGSLRGQRELPQHLVRSGGQALQGPQRAYVDHAPIAPPRNCLHPRPGAMRVGVFDEFRGATLPWPARPSGTARQIARHCAGSRTACAPRLPAPCLNPSVVRLPRPNPSGVAVALHDEGSQLLPRT